MDQNFTDVIWDIGIVRSQNPPMLSTKGLNYSHRPDIFIGKDNR